MQLYYIDSVKGDSHIKTQLIREINALIVLHGGRTLSPQDFDILYDLDIDQLVTVKYDIEKTYQQQLVHN